MKTQNPALCSKLTRETLDQVVRTLRRKYGRKLRRYGIDADDIMQSATVSALDTMQNFRGQSSFTTWLTSVVLNVTKMELRKRAIRERLHVLLPPPPESQDIEARLDRLRLAASALAIISQRVPKAIETVRMVADGYNYAEVAQATGVPVNTARTRWFYAIHAAQRTLTTG